MTEIAVAFAGGLVTSIGPCVAPRYLAIAALTSGGRAALVTAAFVAGLVGAYDALGFIAGALGALFDGSAAIYTALAVAMIVCGIWTLTTARPAEHRHDTVPTVSLGGALLAGAASALVVSPCCTPIVAAIVAGAGAAGRPLAGVALLTVFALGHAAPLAIAGLAGARLARGMRQLAASQAPAIVAGSLMLALGAYYGAVA